MFVTKQAGVARQTGELTKLEAIYRVALFQTATIEYSLVRVRVSECVCVCLCVGVFLYVNTITKKKRINQLET